MHNTYNYIYAQSNNYPSIATTLHLIHPLPSPPLSPYTPQFILLLEREKAMLRESSWDCTDTVSDMLSVTEGAVYRPFVLFDPPPPPAVAPPPPPPIAHTPTLQEALPSGHGCAASAPSYSPPRYLPATLLAVRAPAALTACM